MKLYKYTVSHNDIWQCFVGTGFAYEKGILNIFDENGTLAMFKEWDYLIRDRMNEETSL